MRLAGHEPRLRLLRLRIFLLHCPAQLCTEEDALQNLRFASGSVGHSFHETLGMKHEHLANRWSQAVLREGHTSTDRSQKAMRREQCLCNPLCTSYI